MTKNRYFNELKPWYKPYQPSTSAVTKSNNKGKYNDKSSSPDSDILLFESRFESGNLKEAIQIDRSEYELVLKPDYSTKNYT